MTPIDAIFEHAAVLAAHRLDIERWLVEAILADPARGLTVARETMKMTWSLVSDEDLCDILLSAEALRRMGRLEASPLDAQDHIHRLVRRTMRRDGRWADATSSGWSAMWNDERLTALMSAEYHSPVVIAYAIAQLAAIDYRQSEATEHLAAAYAAIAGEAA